MIKKCNMCRKYSDAICDIRLCVYLPVMSDRGKEFDEEDATIEFTLCRKCASDVASFIDNKRPTHYISGYPANYSRQLNTELDASANN